MDMISIIIPIYNVSKYIKECLDSVINQTYKNLEIICVDDCGIDDSMQIVQRYAEKDERIKILRHTENQGLPAARNTALKKTEGKYVFFLDSDDYLKTDIIEKLYNKIIQTNADFVFASYISFPENTNNKNLVKKANKSCLSAPDTDNYEINFHNLEDCFAGIPCMAWGKLFSKEFLISNNIYFINQNAMFEDNGFYIKILSNFPKTASISDVGVIYRIRDNSITSVFDSWKKRSEKLASFKLVLDDAFSYIDDNLSLEDAKHIRKLIKNLEVYNWYFDEWFEFFYKRRWGRANKRIQLLGIPIFRQKKKKGKVVTKILGITCKKTVID